jgi:hypothetical protein
MTCNKAGAVQCHHSSSADAQPRMRIPAGLPADIVKHPQVAHRYIKTLILVRRSKARQPHAVLSSCLTSPFGVRVYNRLQHLQTSAWLRIPGRHYALSCKGRKPLQEQPDTAHSQTSCTHMICVHTSGRTCSESVPQMQGNHIRKTLYGVCSQQFAAACTNVSSKKLTLTASIPACTCTPP